MAYPFVAAKWFTPGAIVEVRALVVHHAEGGGTVNYFRTTTRNVSSHYVIDYSGRIVQMVRDGDASHTQHKEAEPYTSEDFGIYSPDVARAVIGLDGWADPNRYVHSVEIEGFRAQGPNAAQAASLVALVADLRSRFPLRGLLGHRDIQDKSCPGGLIPWASVGGHGLWSDDVNLSVVKGEDWTPKDTRRPVRATPDRGAGQVIGYIEAGAVVRTIAEAETPDGNRWRLTELSGKPGWILRTDFDPLVPGGDPATDAALTAYIARTPAPPPDCTTQVADAYARGFSKGAEDGHASGYKAGAGRVGERVRAESVPALLADVDRIVAEETA